MLWVDKIANDIKRRLSDRISDGKELIVRDEKTASGRVHIGSMRGVAIHGLVSDVLNEMGIPAKFLYEINDFDPMDGLPVYLDKKKYEKYMGMPLCDVPAPDDTAQNFAEYFANEFKNVIKEAGFNPEYYRASELYRSGKMNDLIRLALENTDKIREIYKKVSGSIKPDDWMPLNVVCEKCGRIGTTKVIDFDGEKVSYVCESNMVDWARGCGHNGKVSPFDGNAKLPWKVEWAAKFKALNVDIEGAGKDHSTKGGSRDVASAIAKEVFNYQAPYNIPYEFFLVGGAKMSSSKGSGSSSKEIKDLLPRKIFRYLMFARKPMQAINFDPTGDTIPTLFDNYDKIAEDYWNNVESDTLRLFELVHEGNPPKERYFLPRFSTIAFLSQMPHIDLANEFAKIKESELNDIEINELRERLKYAKLWLEKYAPESFIFEIQKDLPEEAKHFSDEQKRALTLVYEFLKNNNPDGQDMHTELHNIKKKTEINPKDFFSAIYIAILGKDSGPKAGWFLSVLDRDFLLNRLKEVI